MNFSNQQEAKKAATVEAMHDAALSVFHKAYPTPTLECLDALQTFAATTIFNMCELMGGEDGSAFVNALAELVSENKGEIDKKRARAMQRDSRMH